MILSVITDCLTLAERQQIELWVVRLNHNENQFSHYDVRGKYIDEMSGWLLIQTADIIHPDLNEESLRAIFDDLGLSFELNPESKFEDELYQVSIHSDCIEASEEISELFQSRYFGGTEPGDEGWTALEYISAREFEVLLGWLRKNHSKLTRAYAYKNGVRIDHESKNFEHEQEVLLSWSAGDLWIDLD